MQDAGYYTVEALVSAFNNHLWAVKGISPAKAVRILTEATKLVPVFITAAEYYQRRMSLSRIVTGSKKLDKLLGGGIKRGTITELFGEPGTGKTAICHTLAVTCQLPVNRGGAEGKCLYIDTEYNFRPERLLAVAERYKLNGNEVLGNVDYASVYNSQHQIDLLLLAADMMRKSEYQYGLLILNSCTEFYRTDNQEDGEQCNRKAPLALIMRDLQKIADLYKVAVLITNQIVATSSESSDEDSDEAQMYSVYSKKKSVVNVVAHESKVRVYLRKPRIDMRKCVK